MSWLHIIEHIVVAAVVIRVLLLVKERGLKGTVGLWLTRFVRRLPGVNAFIDSKFDTEVDKMIDINFRGMRELDTVDALPARGLSHDAVLERMGKFRKFDVDGEKGVTFAYVYSAGHEHNEFLQRVCAEYAHTNGLNPTMFRSLKQMEVEVVSMCAKMLNAPPSCRGTMSSGGSESIQLAIKTYRDRARALFPHIKHPEMVIPITGHYAFEKASQMFDVKCVYVKVNPKTQTVAAEDMRRAVTPNTILLVVSAPQYPHGVMDPIADVAALGQELDLPVHVDACIGGFVLPFVKKLGFDVPPFDFSLPGVTSISLDVHKYGFGLKGASVILYRSEEYRRFQFFVFSTWPGGMVITPTLLGTRPGMPIACAWATMMAMGESGYVENVEKVMRAVRAMQAAVRDIPELRIVGTPVATLFAVTSDEVNVYAVADEMEARGWRMERMSYPPALHFTVTPPHEHTTDRFRADLTASVAHVRAHPELVKQGSAAAQGMVAAIPDDAIVDDFLLKFAEKVYAK